MELRIKELLQEQGLRMSDLADRLGTNQSNLTKSLANNPKLSTLQDVAKALHVKVHELFTPNIPTTPTGVAIVGDRAFGMIEMASVVQIPFFNDYSKLRKEVRRFLLDTLDGGKTQAFCALVGGYELCSLVHDRGNKTIILTLFYGLQQAQTFFFDLMEYGDWRNGEDKEPVWDFEQLTWDIIGDIENVVPMEFGDYSTPADRELDAES